MNRINLTYSPYREHAREHVKSMPNKVATAVISNDLIKFDISPQLIVVVLTLISIVLGVVFLFSYNKNATKGYALKRLEMIRQDLVGDSQKVDLQLSQAKSMTAMLGSERMSIMRKPSNFQYISPSDTFLASVK